MTKVTSVRWRLINYSRAEDAPAVILAIQPKLAGHSHTSEEAVVLAPNSALPFESMR